VVGLPNELNIIPRNDIASWLYSCGLTSVFELLIDQSSSSQNLCEMIVVNSVKNNFIKNVFNVFDCNTVPRCTW